MSEQGYEQLTLFPADFLASRSAQPGSAEAVRMTVTSGQRCSELSRKFGPLGCLEKMLLESSTWRSTRCWLTWKVKATKQGRLYFQLAVSTPRTGVTEYASWAGSEERPIYFIPTPTTQNRPVSEAAKKKYKSSPSLEDYIRLWPTPTTGAGLCGGTGNYNQLKALEEAGEISPEERRSMAAGNGGQLNPDWVEAMMGFPPGWTKSEPGGQTELGKQESQE